MVKQGTKELLWWIATPGLIASRELARIRYFKSRHLRLHVGAGTVMLRGFLNVDINLLKNPDLWLDVRRGLPLQNESVSFIYTSHTIEHLSLGEIGDLLSECYRVLEDGASIRIVVPDLGKAIAAYADHDVDWFIDWPHRFRSLGGRFANYILCDAQHKCAFDSEFLEELLCAADFCDVKAMALGESGAPSHYWPDLAELEEKSLDDRSLIVEAKKRVK